MLYLGLGCRPIRVEVVRGSEVRDLYWEVRGIWQQELQRGLCGSPQSVWASPSGIRVGEGGPPTRSLVTQVLPEIRFSPMEALH